MNNYKIIVTLLVLSSVFSCSSNREEPDEKLPNISISYTNGQFHYPYTKSELLKLLKDVYNDPDKVIAGQKVRSFGLSYEPSSVTKDIENFHQVTGKYPAIIGVEISSENDDLNDAGNLVKDLVKFAEAGGIITINSHIINPVPGENSYRGTLGGINGWKELLTKGSTLNKSLFTKLDRVGKILQLLKKSDVPVIFRPFHEMNGNWFWWCIKDQNNVYDKNYYIDLWKMVYNYYTNNLGLDNLIWEYSPFVYSEGSTTDVMYCYPGDEYVDIVGLDWYTSGNFEINTNSSYNKLAATNKPVAIGEIGPTASTSSNMAYGQFTCKNLLNIMYKMREKNFKTCYFLCWTSWIDINGKKNQMSIPDMGDSDMLMADDLIISRDEL